MACGRLLRPVVPLDAGSLRTAGARPLASPLEALQSALLGAMREAPCMVSFSGGRDSSAVLAAAVTAARSHGLPLPIPVSVRFPDAPDTEESRWQERVIAHLKLDEWVKIDVADGDMDIVGPWAASILERHGLLTPANIVFVTATVQAASGSRLLTGLGGDDVFVEWRWRELADALVGRRRLNRFDVLDAGYLLLPRRARASLDRRYLTAPAPEWLRPDARREVNALLAAERLDEPPNWPAWLRWCAGRCHLPAVTTAFATLAADAGTELMHPLLDPGFLAALGQAAGSKGFGDRTTIMQKVFGTVLPPDVCARPDKASFHDVYWTDHAREFVAGWNGDGVDTDLVDAVALRREWSERVPDTRSWLLVQQAWLASQPGC